MMAWRAAAVVAVLLTAAPAQSVTLSRAEALDARVSPAELRQLARQIDTSPAVEMQPAARAPAATADRTADRTGTVAAGPSASVVRPAERQTLEQGTVQLVETARPTEARLATVVASKPAIKTLLRDEGSMLETLPGIVRQRDERGRELRLKSYVLLSRPLTYDRTRGLFTGSIVVGVADIGPAPDGQKLTSPITFQVLGNGTATPNPLRLDRTSPPHSEIAISTPSAPGGVTITVASNFNPQGQAVMLPLAPYLQLETASSEVEGFGLGLTELNVEVAGLPNPKGRVVSLRSRPGAFLSNSRLVLDENGMASTQLRSRGTGPVVLRASMAGIPDAETRIRFGFPWLTMAAALLGGLVGALIRLLLGPSSGSRARHVRGFFASALFGILVFALYAVGVNVLPVSPTVTVGATLVFAVAALGAFLGTALIGKVDKPNDI